MFKQSLRLFGIAYKNNKSSKSILAIVLILEALSILALYFLNKQYGFIYQGIQDYNIPMIYKGIQWFCGIAGGLVLVGGLITFYTNKLAFSIRQGLTKYYIEIYLSLKKTDNIEQRIQEDLRNFGEKSCEFWFAVLRSVVKLPIFLGVVISLTQWYIGLIVLVAIAVGTYLTKIIAKKLIILQAHQESNEAEFRQAIAKRKDIQVYFIKIHNTFLKINREVKKLSFLQSGLGQSFVLLPFILLLPLYVSKLVTMGAFMQSVNALSKVIDSLTVLIDNRQVVVAISSCLKRMEALDDRK